MKNKLFKCLAVIPARSGSQRFKNKNIYKYKGIPFLGRAILIAQKSNLFDKVIVSTDSQYYAKIANKFGAETPFIRPKYLSGNRIITVPVIKHAIDYYEKKKSYFDFVCCIFPCTPYLDHHLLIEYFRYLKKYKANYVYPIKRYEHPIEKAITITKSFKPKYLFANRELSRTQDLKNFYYDCGQFYWGKSSAWKKNLKMHTDGIAIPTSKKLLEVDDINDIYELKK